MRKTQEKHGHRGPFTAPLPVERPSQATPIAFSLKIFARTITLCYNDSCQNLRSER